MEKILAEIRKKDSAFRVEFSYLATGEVLCWLCYKDKQLKQSCESGKDHKESLINAYKKTQE